MAELVRTEVVTGAAGAALMVVPNDRYLDLAPGRARRCAIRRRGSRPTPRSARSRPAATSARCRPLSLYVMAPMYVDPAIADRPQLLFPAGRSDAIVAVQRAELLRDDPYVVAPLTRESAVP